MVNTCENSPWHRESNVGIHTDMVVGFFSSKYSGEWTKDHVIGFLACAFHDVGKPVSLAWKESEARGEYKVFHGHELASARMFEDYICDNLEEITNLGVNAHDIYGISWLIEHHLPWGTKNKTTIDQYVKTLFEIFESDGLEFFSDILMADTYGRLSDDYPEKISSAKDWIKNFCEIGHTVKRIEADLENDKILLVPIAVSGSGKSTFFKTLGNDIEHYSLDELREKWYPSETYVESFELACADKQFMSKVHAEFIKLLKTGKSIYVDEMNLSKKRRGFVVTEARKKGYTVIAVTFPISVNRLIHQQENRTDKVISRDIYSSMYQRLQQPSYGEFDIVRIKHNETDISESIHN